MALRVLVAYSMSSTFTPTTLDYLNAFRNYLSEHIPVSVEYLSVTQDPQLRVSLDDYDVVIQSYCARLCFVGYVSEGFIEMMRRYGGLKILAVQDEYNRTDVLKRAIQRISFDVVLTCVPQDSLDYVYPSAEFRTTRFETVFTGYVPEHLVDTPRPISPLRDRPIVIGYRGRDIGGIYGQLAFDKFEIGRRMRAVCEERGIPQDIAMDEASRIYGEAWFDFLGSCRAMLGSESGSNVFDFDGSLEQRFLRMEKEQGRRPSYEEFRPFVAERDQAIAMGQISPRIFECAVMRTPMVLYCGRYSDAIEPDTHYIPLEKDFSNVEAVLARLERLDELEAMTERAWQHLVGSGDFGYRAFMGRVACIITEELERRAIRERHSTARVGEIGPYKALAYHAQAPTSAPKPFSAFEALQRKQYVIQQQEAVPSQHQVVRRLIARFRELARDIGPRLTAGSATASFEAFVLLLDEAEEQIEDMRHARDDWMSLRQELAMMDDPQLVEALQQDLRRQLDAMSGLSRRVPEAFIHMYADVKSSLPIGYRARLAVVLRLRRLIGPVVRDLAARVPPHIGQRARDRLRALRRRAG
jgi:hypothetical protein